MGIDVTKVVVGILGGIVVWNSLDEDRKQHLGEVAKGVANNLSDVVQRANELNQQQRAQEALKYLMNPTSAPANPTTHPLAPPRPDSAAHTQSIQTGHLPSLVDIDYQWLKVIVPPAVIMIAGKRGSGKSVLAYRLLELFRYSLRPYVVGVPDEARRHLPDWVGIAPTLADVPNNAIAIIDEAYIQYHARSSNFSRALSLSQSLNLSRQRGQVLVFVTQEARQIDKNIVSSASVVIFKDLGMLQLEFDRPELRNLATKAQQYFDGIKGDKRAHSFVYAPDSDFLGPLQNAKPSFWNAGMSHMFSDVGPTPATPKKAKELSRESRIEKARELNTLGWSLKEIGDYLGVSKATVVNYLKGYPYRH